MDGEDVKPVDVRDLGGVRVKLFAWDAADIATSPARAETMEQYGAPSPDELVEWDDNGWDDCDIMSSITGMMLKPLTPAMTAAIKPLL